MSPLLDEFNATAAKAQRSTEVLEIAVTKYSAMLEFKATPEDRPALAAAMLDCALKFLENLTDPVRQGSISNDTISTVKYALKTLTSPASVALLPPDTGARLADISLAFTRKAENFNRDNFSGTWNEFSQYKGYLRDLGRISLSYAQAFKAFTDEQSENVATSKNVLPVRKLVLKKEPSQDP